MTSTDQIHTGIWREIPEKDNPYAAASCFCYGYDVYGDILGKASWSEYILLLFTGSKPSLSQAKLIEQLAIAIANPGPRDHSVRAAMNGGVGGSTNAACLFAALAVGAGQLGGAHEVILCMNLLKSASHDLPNLQQILKSINKQKGVDIWPELDHVPGFDPYAPNCSTPVLQTLDCLLQHSPAGMLQWLADNRTHIECVITCPLAMTGVIAAAFLDLGLSKQQAELLYLILRLPGAAVHALEQSRLGWKRYPFFKDGLVLQNDPGPNQRHVQQESA